MNTHPSAPPKRTGESRLPWRAKGLSRQQSRIVQWANGYKQNNPWITSLDAARWVEYRMSGLDDFDPDRKPGAARLRSVQRAMAGLVRQGLLVKDGRRYATPRAAEKWRRLQARRARERCAALADPEVAKMIVAAEKIAAYCDQQWSRYYEEGLASREPIPVEGWRLLRRAVNQAKLDATRVIARGKYREVMAAPWQCLWEGCDWEGPRREAKVHARAAHPDG